MNRHVWLTAIPFALLLMLGTTAGLMATSFPKAQGTFRQAAVDLPDVVLTDHAAQTGTLLSDRVADGLVVVNFNFTACKSICGVGNAIMQQLDGTIPGHLKRPVRLLSITINPEADMAEVLAKAASEYGPSERWRWATGTRGDIDTILERAGARVADIETHDLVFIVGDGKSRRFHRVPSVSPTADEVVAALAEYDR